MGAPELPSDPGQEDVNPTQAVVHHPPVPSDDSDYEMNNTIDAYHGYQPLAMGDEPSDVAMDDRDSEDVDGDNDVSQETTIHKAESEIAHGSDLAENLPKVESVDTEIERQVWSEPRPKELLLDLDNTKTTQILNVMANITLPNAVVPDWAAGVPEERWKEELLERIRRRGESRATTNKETNA
ncbi:uncharacterized protein [Eurosta solidaginis]|uniref:uncharacterized protein n=1 Tax=Eurosta solidaginis TaxID=178769 RepID=UPI003530C3AD